MGAPRAQPVPVRRGRRISPVFPRPSYQNGVVSGSGRGYPDVALDADPTTGMLVGETQIFPKGTFYGEYRIGGTSLASPLMAGIVADAAQHAGSRLGFLNIAIYKLAKAHFGAFRDVRSIPGANVRPDFANGLNFGAAGHWVFERLRVAAGLRRIRRRICGTR